VRDQDEVDRRFYAIVTDLVGTPTELVTPTGEIAWQQRTTIWGIPTHVSTAGADCPLRFPGQIHDPETGASYNYHRYYDPDSGRYLSGDPLNLFGGLDPFAYVSNPTSAVDPLALTPCKTFPNQMESTLEAELAHADSLGVRPVSPGASGFDEAINSGTVKWAVAEDGAVRVMPKVVSGQEIAHTALTRGAPVRSAGEADIAGGNGSYFGLEISNHSGHYIPSNASLDGAVDAFRNLGINFSPEAIVYAAP
jgi:RHS repeat-associated protein